MREESVRCEELHCRPRKLVASMCRMGQFECDAVSMQINVDMSYRSLHCIVGALCTCQMRANIKGITLTYNASGRVTFQLA